MVLPNITTEPPCVSIPRAATLVNATLNELNAAMASDPELAALVFKVGSAKAVLTCDVPKIREAMAARNRATGMI